MGRASSTVTAAADEPLLMGCERIQCHRTRRAKVSLAALTGPVAACWTSRPRRPITAIKGFKRTDNFQKCQEPAPGRLSRYLCWTNKLYLNPPWRGVWTRDRAFKHSTVRNRCCQPGTESFGIASLRIVQGELGVGRRKAPAQPNASKSRFGNRAAWCGFR